jgi:hypothetical protein
MYVKSIDMLFIYVYMSCQSPGHALIARREVLMVTAFHEWCYPREMAFEVTKNIGFKQQKTKFY